MSRGAAVTRPAGVTLDGVALGKARRLPSLILTRREGEEVVILTASGEVVVVGVVSVRGAGKKAKVRIGFRASRSTDVWRTELVEAGGGGVGGGGGEHKEMGACANLSADS